MDTNASLSLRQAQSKIGLAQDYPGSFVTLNNAVLRLLADGMVDAKTMITHASA